MASEGSPPNRWVPRLHLSLAAFDSLATATWVLVRPEGLFTWLRLAATPNALFLARVLGVLTLSHVPCLVLAARQRDTWGGLVYVPLIGRSLLAGLWLWLLGSERVHPSTTALCWLLIHDLYWLLIFLAFVLLLRRAVNR